MLCIGIIEAKLSSKENNDELFDAFCEVKVDNQEIRKTSVIKKSANPVWNEIFQFKFKEKYKINIKILDHDLIGDSYPLSEFSINTDDFIDHEISDKWYDESTINDKNEKDKLHLVIAYIRNNTRNPHATFKKFHKECYMKKRKYMRSKPTI